MRRSLSYPKDGDEKVRDSNKQLRAQIKRLRKENDLLRRELENIQKPARVRKEPLPPPEPAEKYEGLEGVKTPSKEEWRKDFIKNFKPKGGKRGEEKS